MDCSPTSTGHAPCSILAACGACRPHAYTAGSAARDHHDARSSPGGGLPVRRQFPFPAAAEWGGHARAGRRAGEFGIGIIPTTGGSITTGIHLLHGHQRLPASSRCFCSRCASSQRASRLKVLAAQMAQHAGDTQMARMLWTPLIRARGQTVRANATAHLRALRVAEDVTELEDLAARYQQQTGLLPLQLFRTASHRHATGHAGRPSRPHLQTDA